MLTAQNEADKVSKRIRQRKGRGRPANSGLDATRAGAVSPRALWQSSRPAAPRMMQRFDRPPIGAAAGPVHRRPSPWYIMWPSYARRLPPPPPPRRPACWPRPIAATIAVVFRKRAAGALPTGRQAPAKPVKPPPRTLAEEAGTFVKAQRVTTALAALTVTGGGRAAHHQPDPDAQRNPRVHEGATLPA